MSSCYANDIGVGKRAITVKHHLHCNDSNSSDVDIPARYRVRVSVAPLIRTFKTEFERLKRIFCYTPNFIS